MLRSRSLLPALACALAGCEAPVTPTAPAPELALSGGLVFTQSYVMAPLPLLPVGINDGGVIAGNVDGDAARLHNGVLTKLPRLPYLAGVYQARAINRNGAVVGGVAGGRGLLWLAPNQLPVSLFAPGGGGGTLTATAINRSNVVVGSYVIGLDKPRAFRWTQAGGAVDITPLGFVTAVATDVNEAGYAVGFGKLASDTFPRPIRWAPNATPTSGVVVLGVGRATVVRNSGDAAGTNPALTQTRLWPFLGGATSLPGPQASSVDDYSENGRLVGFTFASSPVSPRRPWTFLGGTTTWLALPNASLTTAVEGLRVNACGSIVGTQVITTGVRTGLLWTKSLSCDQGDGVILP